MLSKPNAQSADQTRRWEFAFSLLALVIALGVQVSSAWPGLSRIAEREETLQAITIRSLAADGMQIDYPVPVLGYPWTLPGTFGLNANLSSSVMRLTSWPAELSGRGVALVFFYLGLPALYLLARRLGASASGGLLALAFWLLTPFGRIHSTALSETTAALAFATWWLWFFLASLTPPSLGSRLGAALTGIVALICGPILFAPFLLAGLLFWHLEQRRSSQTVSHALSAGIAFLPALVAGLLWMRHTDALKAANPYAAFLSSSPLFHAAVGSWSDRLNKDFWMVSGGNALDSLVSPLTFLLLLVFAGAGFASQRTALGRLALAAVLALVALVPYYNNHPAALAPLGLFTALALALLVGNIFHFSLALPWVRAATAALVLAAQFKLENSAVLETTNQLPTTRKLADAVAALTEPTDIVVTSGQDWDPSFAYWTARRSILIPAGQETRMDLLTRAFGPSDDRRCGAVVLTGRYRSETKYVAELRQRFGLSERPILKTGASDVYVPAARDGALRERLANSPHAALLFHDTPPAPPPPPQVIATPAPLSPGPKLDPFSMMSPRPVKTVVPYDVTALLVEGVPHFFAHAPTTLEFALPTGASQLAFEFFMPEGTYTGKGDSDGTEVLASVRHADGRSEEVFRRALDPRSTYADRQVVAAEVPINAEPGSTVLIQTTPGPSGHANFDWVYIRRVEIK